MSQCPSEQSAPGALAVLAQQLHCTPEPGAETSSFSWSRWEGLRDLFGVREMRSLWFWCWLAASARTLTQLFRWSSETHLRISHCWGCSCPCPWGGMLQPLFSNNFPLSIGSSFSVIYQQTSYCFNIYLFTKEERKTPGGCWHNCDTIEFIAFPEGMPFSLLRSLC